MLTVGLISVCWILTVYLTTHFQLLTLCDFEYMSIFKANSEGVIIKAAGGFCLPAAVMGLMEVLREVISAL